MEVDEVEVRKQVVEILLAAAPDSFKTEDLRQLVDKIMRLIRTA